MVYTHPEVLEQGGEFIHPTTGLDLELIVDAGLDPLDNQPVSVLDWTLDSGWYTDT